MIFYTNTLKNATNRSKNPCDGGGGEGIGVKIRGPSCCSSGNAWVCSRRTVDGMMTMIDAHTHAPTLFSSRSRSCSRTRSRSRSLPLCFTFWRRMRGSVNCNQRCIRQRTDLVRRVAACCWATAAQEVHEVIAEREQPEQVTRVLGNWIRLVAAVCSLKCAVFLSLSLPVPLRCSRSAVAERALGLVAISRAGLKLRFHAHSLCLL